MLNHPSYAVLFPFTICARLVLSHRRADFLPTVLLVIFESSFVPSAIRLLSSDVREAVFLAVGEATAVRSPLRRSSELAVSMPLTFFPASFVFIASGVGLYAEAMLSTVDP